MHRVRTQAFSTPNLIHFDRRFFFFFSLSSPSKDQTTASFINRVPSTIKTTLSIVPIAIRGPFLADHRKFVNRRTMKRCPSNFASVTETPTIPSFRYSPDLFSPFERRASVRGLITVQVEKRFSTSVKAFFFFPSFDLIFPRFFPI